MSDYAGKIAVVTGASRGIGFAVAKLFAQRGATLVVVAREPARLQQAAETLAPLGDAATPPLAVAEDLGGAGAADRIVAAALERFGRIDILANIAGAFPTAALEATDDRMFADTLASNLGATFSMMRAVLPVMRRQGSGTIVSMSSIAARFPTPGLAVYGASKAGVEALTRALAVEAAPLIRVNAVSAGPTLTEAVRDLVRTDTSGAVAAVSKSLPLGRFAEPEEIAEAVLFLASDRATAITGQVLQVNCGGLMA